MLKLEKTLGGNIIINKHRVPKTVLVLLICLLSLLFTACNKETESISAPIESVPLCYDPQIANSKDLNTIINNLFEGLIRIDKNGNIQRGVATDWNISSDGLKYTFNLDPNAKWFVPKSASEILGEDYKETFDTKLTADDFVFAFKRALSEETNAPLYETISMVKNVYAESDTRLIIELSNAFDGFLSVLATPICMPCNEEFFEATAGRYGLSKGLIISNGPYYLSSFDKENGVTLRKNEEYEGKYKTISSVVVLSVDSEDGKSKYNVKEVSLDELNNLDSTYETTKYKNSIKGFCINSKRKSLSNKDIRIALAKATNVDSLISNEETKAEGIVPSCCWISAGSSYRANSNQANLYKYNLKDASKIFNDNKQSVSFTLLCLKSDESAMKIIIGDWQKAFGVSLSVKLKAVDTEIELQNLVSKGKYDIAYTSYTTDDYLAIDFLSEFTKSSLVNVIRLNDKEYNELLDKAYNTEETKDFVANLKACENYIIENAYIIPTIAQDSYLAKTVEAKDVTVRPSGAVFAFYK